jgi:hypothetical protein
MPDRFSSGVKYCTLVSSQVTFRPRTVYPCNLSPRRCSADTATRCAFWSNVNICGNDRTHSYLNKCSWIIVLVLATCMPVLDATSRTVIRPSFPKSALPRDECAHPVELLAECEHALGATLLTTFRKLTVRIMDT